MKITVHVPAKINLALDIVGKREDGYHLVQMVMQSVDLYDSVTVEPDGSKDIKLYSNIDIVDNVEENTAYKAAVEFFKYTSIKNLGIKINLRKRIPMQAGLAGGSADAAGVIIGLDRLFNTNLSKRKILEIGAKIGADVPFCIIGGTMFSEGIGTILEPIADLPYCHIVLHKPPIGISTKEAYEKSDIAGYIKLTKVSSVVNSIYNGNLKEISKLIFNRFEYVMNIGEVKRIKEKMKSLGALNACMSGSGPTVFGIFDSRIKAEHCFYELKRDNKETFLCKPTNGCIIE